MVPATTNTLKGHYTSTAAKSSSKSLGKTGKALEAHEALKKKQARCLTWLRILTIKRIAELSHFLLSGATAKKATTTERENSLEVFHLSECFCFPFSFSPPLGGTKTPARHEKEETGDVRETD